jgi:type I restriction enzyme M protein
MYQHLMDYWKQAMRDDCYMIVEDGWQATLEPVRTNKGKIKKGQFECELIRKPLVIDRYFPDEQAEIEELKQKQETADQTMDELEQEHAHEEGLLGNCLSDAGNITKTNLNKRVKQIKDDPESAEEFEVVREYKDAYDAASKAKKKVKKAEKTLKKQVNEKYPKLLPDEVQTLVVDDKWLPAVKQKMDDEVDAISRQLTQRLAALAERYDKAVTEIDAEVDTLETKVNSHLDQMGVAWN